MARLIPSLSRRLGEIFEGAPPEETPEAVEAVIPVVVARDSEHYTAATVLHLFM